MDKLPQEIEDNDNSGKVKMDLVIIDKKESEVSRKTELEDQVRQLLRYTMNQCNDTITKIKEL